VVTSPFGQRGDEFHSGVDLRNPLGEPVYSTDAGVVRVVYYDEKGGNQIIVYNNDGSISGYAHTAPSNIHNGSQVTEGQIIGYSDASGGVDPHLHYTYRPTQGAEKINPMAHLNGSSNGDEDCDKMAKKSDWRTNLMKIVRKVFNWLYN
jgi:murein DD-endopeptidase MepM/ murein hydrolase activator NlpD